MGSQEIKLLEENNQLLREQIAVNKGLQNSLLCLSESIPDLAKALGHNKKMNDIKNKQDELSRQAKKLIKDLKNKGKIIPIKKK